MIASLKQIARWYATSWVLLLTHTLCLCIGAAWMLIAIVGVFRARGVL